MEDVLSHVLKPDHERSRTTFMSRNALHPQNLLTIFDQNEVTHGWLLEQCKY
jgi:hypothetical protein